jgi:hypothetical protein
VLRKSAGAGARRIGGGGAIEIATVAALVGAVLMITAEFLDLFKVVSVSGSAIDEATRSGGENHGFALGVIGAVSIAAIFLARSTERWLPAAGAAVLGGLALLIVLLGDLPDTSRTELTDTHQIGKAEPAIGLWVELAGALMVTFAATTVAYLLRERQPPPPETGTPRSSG